MLPADVEDNWTLDYGNPAYVQNDLCSLLDVSPVLVEENTDSQGGKISFTPQKTGDYYVYVTDRQIEKVTVYSGESSRTFDNVTGDISWSWETALMDRRLPWKTGTAGSVPWKPRYGGLIWRLWKRCMRNWTRIP